MSLRLWLHRHGLRYRIHDRSLPGKPDVAFIRAAVAVFVDGEFWHGKILKEAGPEQFLATFKSDRRDWWLDKIRKNVERDARVDDELRALGYEVVRVWGREIERSLLAVGPGIADLVRRRLTEREQAGIKPYFRRKPSS